MTTYFARHANGLDVDEETRKMLWKSCLIAVHFPHDKHGKLLEEDNKSVDPDDYEGGSAAHQAMEALNEIALQGGYVCAHHLNHEEIQIGFVPPQKIKLMDGKWGTLWGLQSRNVAVLKT